MESSIGYDFMHEYFKRLKLSINTPYFTYIRMCVVIHCFDFVEGECSKNK